MTPRLPTTAHALAVIARLTLRRLRASRMAWAGAAIALGPLILAGAMRGDADPRTVFVIELLLLGVVPPLLVASSIGEELERRTATYLWSRPIARWTVLAGKLLALAPLAAALIVASWVAVAMIALGGAPGAASIAALAGGAIALAMASAGIATLAPRHGLALAIAYIVFIDLPIGELPLSLHALSITHQVQALADDGLALAPLATLTALAAGWLAIGLWRIRRVEV